MTFKNILMAETKPANKEIAIADESLMNQIYVIRGQNVKLDRDLAALYGVETRVLKQSVRRNIDRFPEDFMFELTQQEYESLSHPSEYPNHALVHPHPPNAYRQYGPATRTS